jgi:chemotaxis protein MotB
MPKNKEGTVIIKKVVKGGHGGHHGGSWKVAYADFVTAMMAFFLLMWLVAAASQTQKQQIAGYFKEYSLFEGLSDKPGASETPPPAGTKGGPQESSPAGGLDPGQSETNMTNEKLVDILTERIESRLEDLKDQISIDIFDKGVRIEATHKEGQPLFDSGSSSPTPAGKKIFSEIGFGIKDLPNMIAIEGHTDAVKFSGDKYTNWELSTDRASTARRILQQSGVNADHIYRVAGYASSIPLNPTNPYDPKNRRISILIFNQDIPLN